MGPAVLTHDDFAPRVLDWYARHGRHDLPWQREPTAYRVWVSEIMLQQTQVTTVIPYFQRFVKRFPDVIALAAAGQDEVLHLWSGLGYYARARNLHRAAQSVREDFAGRFPESLDGLLALPGIGRSTAGAILALAHGQRHPILDGNVKRVLCRYFAISGWTGASKIEKHLWSLAESLTPETRVADYTQAMMDLGATLCRRAQPECNACPLAADCRANAEGLQSELPTPKPRKARPLRHTTMLLIIDDDGQVLLRQRPADGLWGGLWSLPEIPPGEDADAWCRQHLGLNPLAAQPMPAVRHGFTHFELEIEPRLLRVSPSGPSRPPGQSGQNACLAVMDDAGWLWYNRRSPSRVGLAAVVERLISMVETVHGTGGDPDEQNGQLRTTESRS